MSVLDIFVECNEAVQQSVLIARANRSDKEFHFQNWFVGRLTALGLNYDPPHRNSYPDFRLVASTFGFELKGLEFPGRIADLASSIDVIIRLGERGTWIEATGIHYADKGTIVHLCVRLARIETTVSSLLKNGDWLRAAGRILEESGCCEVPVPLFQQAVSKSACVVRFG